MGAVQAVRRLPAFRPQGHFLVALGGMVIMLAAAAAVRQGHPALAKLAALEMLVSMPAEVAAAVMAVAARPEALAAQCLPTLEATAVRAQAELVAVRVATARRAAMARRELAVAVVAARI